MNQEFPLFRKDQGKGLAKDNLLAPELSFWDIYSIQTEQTWKKNITASTYRAVTATEEEKNLYQLDEQYRATKLEKENNMLSYLARGAGWLTGTLGDPTDLAMLLFSGGVGGIATKGIAQVGIRKRLAQGAITGATYGAIKEPLLRLQEGIDTSPLATTARIAETTIAFPLLGEGLHHAGRFIKGIFTQPTKSPHLNTTHKIESLMNTKSKVFVDESLPEFFTTFDQKTASKLEDIIGKYSYEPEKNIKQVDALQNIKQEIRDIFGKEKKEYALINELEDKLVSSNLTAVEEEQLITLSSIHKEALTKRDNQTKLLDTLIINRQIIDKGEQHIQKELAEIVNYQVEHGKAINTNIQKQSLEHAKTTIESTPIEVASPKENPLIVEIDPILKEELAEITGTIDVLKNVKNLEQIPKSLHQEVKEITNIYEKQLEFNQIASNNLLEDLFQYKDINTGMRVITNRISNESNGLYALTSNQVYNQLKKNNLLDIFEKGAKYWGQELSILNGAKLPSTQLESAKKIASILKETRQPVLQRAKAAGIDIAELTGRVVKQTHNKQKLIQDGFSQWKEFVKPLLSSSKYYSKSMRHDDDLLKFYKSITTNGITKEKATSLLFTNSKIQEIFNYLGINIGKAEKRILHFKSLESAILYNSEYGLNGWGKQFFVDLQELTHKTIQAEQLGIHPEYVLKYVQGKLLKNGVETPSNFIEKILAPLNLSINRNMDSDVVSLWGDRLRAYTSLCMLGKSALSSLPDLFTSYVAPRVIGSSRMQSLGSTIKGISYMINPKARKQSLELFNVVIEGSLADLYNRLGMEVVQVGSSQGALKNFTHLLYKINGQMLWDESLKTGIAESVAKYTGSSLSSKFENLPIAMQSSLLENGIDKVIWKELKKVPLVDGVLLPANISNKNIASKYQGFLIDITHKGIPTGIRATDVHLMQGHRTSSIHPVLKEFATSWLQFKHFPIMFCRHVLAPMFRAATPLVEQKAGTLGTLKDLVASPSVWGSAATLIAGVMTMEYMSLQLKQVISGKKTLEQTFDFNDQDIHHIVHNGSALGVYQMFLSGISGANPWSMSSLLTPPSASPIKDASHIIQKIGDKDFVPTLIEKGSRNVPFNNLLYTDYLLKSSLQNFIKQEYPSYTRKHKKRFINKK